MARRSHFGELSKGATIGLGVFVLVCLVALAIGLYYGLEKKQPSPDGSPVGSPVESPVDAPAETQPVQVYYTDAEARKYMNWDTNATSLFKNWFWVINGGEKYGHGKNYWMGVSDEFIKVNWLNAPLAGAFNIQGQKISDWIMTNGWPEYLVTKIKPS